MAFTDRVVEHPGRVQLTNVSGDVYDMTRAEGDVYTEGTLLNASNLNTQTQLDSTVQTKFAAVETDTSYQNDISNALNYLLESYTLQTSGDWFYIVLGKLFIGIYTAQKTYAIQNASGSIYVSANQTITYPITIDSLKYVGVSHIYSSYPTWAVLNSANASGISFCGASTLSRASTTYRVRVLVFASLA